MVQTCRVTEWGEGIKYNRKGFKLIPAKISSNAKAGALQARYLRVFETDSMKGMG